MRRGPPLYNHWLYLMGMVTGIPVDWPNCRVYTFILRVPRRIANINLGNGNSDSLYDVHCVIRMNRESAMMPLPQINDFCLVSEEIVGLN